MELVCHIGLPKTGTTSIQAYLWAERSRLRREGVFYCRYRARDNAQSEYLFVALDCAHTLHPDPMVRNALGLHSLSEQRQHVEAFEAWIDTRLAASDCRRAIVSCEMLSAFLHGRAPISGLHDWLTGRFTQVSYIIYLRKQSDWLLSIYSEMMRKGFTTRFAEFLETERAPDYAEILERWERSTGPGRLDVRLLDPGFLHPDGLLADFCGAAGIAYVPRARERRRNPRVSVPGLAVMRQVNRLAHAVSGPSRTNRAIRKAGRVLGEILPGRKQAFTAEREARIMESYAQVNAAVCRKYFPDRAALFYAA
jgi:hypothetical protein